MSKTNSRPEPFRLGFVVYLSIFKHVCHKDVIMTLSNVLPFVVVFRHKKT